MLVGSGQYLHLNDGYVCTSLHESSTAIHLGFVYFSVVAYTTVNIFLRNIYQWTGTFRLEGDADKAKGNRSRGNNF